MKHIYPFNVTAGWRWLVALPAIIVFATTGHAQVNGVVFRDFDANGIRSDTLPIETGVEGVPVRAFVGFSQTPLSTITNEDGFYSFSRADLPAGQSVRIEFNDCQSGYYNSGYGRNNGARVQFVRAPANAINLGINYPTDYCQPTGKLLITSCFVNGDSQTIRDKDGNPVSPEKQTILTDAILTFPYKASGIATVSTNRVNPTMTTSVTARTCVGCPATVAAASPGSIISWTGPTNFAAIGPGAQV